MASIDRLRRVSRLEPVRSAEGSLTPGSKLTVRLQPPGSKGMTFKPTVLKADPGGELRWIGHLLFPGLFDGEHHFIIEHTEGGQCTFRPWRAVHWDIGAHHGIIRAV